MLIAGERYPGPATVRKPIHPSSRNFYVLRFRHLLLPYLSVSAVKRSKPLHLGGLSALNAYRKRRNIIQQSTVTSYFCV